MKTTFISLSFLTLAGLLVYQSFNVWSLENTRDLNRSTAIFFRTVAAKNCLKTDAVIKTAKSLGLHIIVLDEKSNLPADKLPFAAVSIVKIKFKPDPFLAPPMFTTFHFDEHGCWSRQ